MRFVCVHDNMKMQKWFCGVSKAFRERKLMGYYQLRFIEWFNNGKFLQLNDSNLNEFSLHLTIKLCLALGINPVYLHARIAIKIRFSLSRKKYS